MASTIGVKQGCPLSPTLFGLYIDEVSRYLERFGGSGARLASIAIQILLYVDDIVLIFDSVEGLQRHLNYFVRTKVCQSTWIKLKCDGV